jgi:hypothetical protein
MFSLCEVQSQRCRAELAGISGALVLRRLDKHALTLSRARSLRAPPGSTRAQLHPVRAAQLVAVPIDDEHPQLVLDEGLFLQAIKTLHELGDRERFSLVDAVREFSRERYVGLRFAEVIEREIEADDMDAIGTYVAAVYLVSHHSASLGSIGYMEEELAAPTLAFIRTAAWAFMSAWTLRYGGLYAHHVVSGRTVVDASVDDPPSAKRQ